MMLTLPSRPISPLSRLAAAVVLSLLLRASVMAEQPDLQLSQLMPGTVVAYAEIPKPRYLIDQAFDHPIALELQKTEEFQAVRSSPDFAPLQALYDLIEEDFGCSWREALCRISEEGLSIGFDLPSQGVVIVAKCRNAEDAEQAKETLLKAIRLRAESQGEKDPIKSKEHRSITCYGINESALAVKDRWLVITSKAPLLRLVINTVLDELPTLHSEEQFQQLYAQRSASNVGWYYADLRLLRATGALKKALGKKSDNPAAEVLAGGIVAAIPDAGYVTGELFWKDNRLSLVNRLPYDRENAAKKKAFYFGSDGEGIAPPLLEVPGTILTLSTYRDFGSMWLNAPDLFDDQVNAKLAEAEGGLTTLFAGRNFRDDILGNIEPGIQLIVAQQQFPLAGVTPALKLPAAAIVVKLKNPEDTARIFKITFQSAIGFLNVVGGMNGLAPLDLNSERENGMLVVSAEYLPPEEKSEQVAAPAHFNALPTALVMNDMFILSSTKPLALAVAKQLDQKRDGNAPVNTEMQADVEIARKLLVENREALLAQNMLEKGHDRQAAEKEIDTLLKLVTLLKGMSLELDTAESEMSLRVNIDVATEVDLVNQPTVSK